MFLRLSLFFTTISLNLHETSGFLFGLLGSSESEEVCEHGKLITRPEINQYFYCNHGDLELIGASSFTIFDQQLINFLSNETDHFI